MLRNVMALIGFLVFCLMVGCSHLIAGPSLDVALKDKDWFLSVNAGSGPFPGAELLLLLLIGLLMAFFIQITAQILRKQWNMTLIRRFLSLGLGLGLWGAIVYQGNLRRSAGEQQIHWIQRQLEGLPDHASASQLEAGLAVFFERQPRLGVLSLLPSEGQNEGRLRLNQDLAGNRFYEVLTWFDRQHLQNWQIQQTQTSDRPTQCQVIARHTQADAMTCR